MKPLLLAISAIVVLSAGGCATTTSVKKTDVHSAIDEADTAYRRLPSALPAYNAAVQKAADRLEKSEPAEFAVSLSQLGVDLTIRTSGCRCATSKFPISPRIPPRSASPSSLDTTPQTRRSIPPSANVTELRKRRKRLECGGFLQATKRQ